MFDRERLRTSRLQTIADIAKEKPLKYKEKRLNYLRILPILETKPFEMHFDFSHRTAIHDCLDFKSLEMTSEYREILIRHVQDSYFESKSHSQILIGISGLTIEAEVPIPETSQFLNDVGDDELQTMFSEIKRDEAFNKNLAVLQDADYSSSILEQQGNFRLGEAEMRRLAYDSFDQNDKGDIKVRHFISDWSQAFIQSKLQVFLNRHD